MNTDIIYDPEEVSLLEASLTTTKASAREEVWLPQHGHARGGIGHLVSTGCSRAGLIRLQQRAVAAKALGATRTAVRQTGDDARATTVALSASCMAPPNSDDAATAGRFSRTQARPSTCGPALGDAAALSAVVGCGAGMPAMAKRPWEVAVPHPHDFVATARPSRAHDVRPGSRWSAVSYYESEPEEIRHHMDVCSIMDAVHEEGVMLQRHMRHTRHASLAEQQRERFRRQRLESAQRYERAGLPARRAYSAVPASRGLALTGAGGSLRAALDAAVAEGGGDVQTPRTAAARRSAMVQLPKPRKYKDPYFKMEQPFEILKPHEVVERNMRSMKEAAQERDTLAHLKCMDMLSARTY
mmetsp:Transcript_1579/g.4250  ORF Transcript_1579/g.4250 Transcript_1579/m.4250 type:complete len:356 (-) Transcript_1579:621-1688(-)